MTASDRSSSLTRLARLGFGRLAEADALLTELSDATGVGRDVLCEHSPVAADPDAALVALERIVRRDPHALDPLRGADDTAWQEEFQLD